MSSETPHDALPGPDDGLGAGAPIRVMIVDDQPLVRGGFAMLIGSQPDMEVVAECGDGRQALERCGQLATDRGAPDVVLMDVRMPVMDGLTATGALLHAHPRTVVMLLTTFDLDEYALEGLRAGASGFLLKDAQPEELLQAIRTCHRGDAVIAPSTTHRLLRHFLSAAPSPAPARAPAPSDERRQRLERLTARERDVFLLMARGLSNAEIMAELVVSEATVKTHVSRVLAKLEARDRVQAVVLAHELGVV